MHEASIVYHLKCLDFCGDLKLSFKKSEPNGLPMDLQENAEWVEWHTDVLLKRNAVENVYQWACGYVFYV